MNSFKEYEPALNGLFGILLEYQNYKLSKFVEVFNSKNITELGKNQKEYRDRDFSRDVVAGCIVEIAFMMIQEYGLPGKKSHWTRHFESEINRLIKEEENPRSNKIELPLEYCVGRQIGHLPLGIVIYAARNQYAHWQNKRISVLNEVVFNHLNSIWSELPNDHSFDLYNSNRIYAYTVIWALGWVTGKRTAIEKFKSDMREMLV